MLIVVRFLWIFPMARLDERVRRHSQEQRAEPVGWREMTIASWAGMRGIVTLAAARLVPAEVEVLLSCLVSPGFTEEGFRLFDCPGSGERWGGSDRDYAV